MTVIEPPVEAKITKRCLDAWVDYYLSTGSKSLAQIYDLICERCDREGLENYYSCYEGFRQAYYRRK